MTSAAPQTEDTTSRLANSIVTLPPLPITAQEILTCFGDEFIDAKKVTAVVEGDPGICAKLLGLSNSAYFGLAEPVHAIEEAISRVLGVDTVRSLVLAMAIQQAFDCKRCPEFRAERFWLQSVLTAECCKKIAYADDGSSDDVRNLAYSTGLCHNLGLMALVHMEPKRSNSALKTRREQGKPNSLPDVFMAELDTNHRMITLELARTWSLPEPMVHAYQYRAFPKSKMDHRLGLVLSIGAAAVENTESEEHEQIDLRSWADEIGISAQELQAMAELTDRQLERVQSLVSNLAR